MKIRTYTICLLLAGCFLRAYSQAQDIAGPERLQRFREAEHSLVLLNNQAALIPLKDLNNLHIASIHWHYPGASVFDSLARKYWEITAFTADSIDTDSGFYALHDQLKFFNTLIIECGSGQPLESRLLDFIRDAETNNRVILLMAGSGTMLPELRGIRSPIILQQRALPESASLAAQLIFGGLAAGNHLDANYGGVFRKGSGFSTKKIRLGYSVPEAVSLNAGLEAGMDSLVEAGIMAHSAPAVVALLVKDGQVVFHKAYGTHTYGGTEETKLDDIFDLASVTKVSATTPAIMRLYDEHRLNLDSPISRYIARTRNIEDKRDIKIKEALLHEAGYTPYIKFYELLKPLDMRPDSSAAYPTKVADHDYLRANFFRDVMWPITLHSPVLTRGRFVYSDLSMYMMKEVAETVSHQKLNDYVFDTLYRPLGMQATGFLPRNRFNRSRIVPTTENDNWFRSMRVQGYVNDPGSAMAGGVEGHAGLFADANDLAILFQMFLNGGEYGGQQYYHPETVRLFTGRQSKVTNRGYGFDRLSEKQEKENRGYPSEQAFGHTGYTGTLVWADPRFHMVFICLTNRVYPDDGKTYGPSKGNLRSALLDFVYRQILASAKAGK